MDVVSGDTLALPTDRFLIALLAEVELESVLPVLALEVLSGQLHGLTVVEVPGPVRHLLRLVSHLS